MFRLLIFLFIVAYSLSGRASNELRELEHNEEIEASYSGFSIGKIVWLQIENSKFLALYTETEKKESVGTAIIMHSMGGHPDEGRLVKPLRTYLPQHNWATLSLQMPVLDVAAKQEDYYFLFDDANARILAAIEYLVVAGVTNIVLIGDELGGMMVTYFLNKNANNTDVKAIVTVSLSVPDSDKKQAQVIDFISEINQPFLDIYAEYDVPDVTDSARKRRVAGKKNSAYRQFRVEGEGHKKQHDEGLMVKRIYSWIRWTFR